MIKALMLGSALVIAASSPTTTPLEAPATAGSSCAASCAESKNSGQTPISKGTKIALVAMGVAALFLRRRR